MVRVTGDPATLMMPRESSPESIEAFRKSMGYDRPLLRPVLDIHDFSIPGRLWKFSIFQETSHATCRGALTSYDGTGRDGATDVRGCCHPIGPGRGRSTPGSIWDMLARLLGLLGQSIPNFWLALLMIFFFAVKLGWFASFGRDDWRSLVMPALCSVCRPWELWYA
jgi:ABC-type dipeptide/oligopeptide/nickel transport system permease component